MKKYAVIVAGGSGTRMNSNIPKQYLLLGDKSILQHTFEVFLKSYEDIELIVVVAINYIDTAKAIVAKTPKPQAIQIVAGGDTRFHSVQNGLRTIKEEGIVFVHDAVRCLVSIKLIHACYTTAMEKGSAIPAISVTDSLRIISGNTHKVLNRDLVKAIQTPQTFKTDWILPAFQQSFDSSFTDEATVVEAMGKPVTLIEGEKENIKITLPADINFAAQLLGVTQ